MGEACEVVVWVVVDEDGDYSVGKDQDAAFTQYGEDYGSSGPQRQVCVTLTVPLPRAVELSGTVPDVDDSGLTLKVG